MQCIENRRDSNVPIKAKTKTGPMPASVLPFSVFKGGNKSRFFSSVHTGGNTHFLGIYGDVESASCAVRQYIDVRIGSSLSESRVTYSGV